MMIFDLTVYRRNVLALIRQCGWTGWSTPLLLAYMYTYKHHFHLTILKYFPISCNGNYDGLGEFLAVCVGGGGGLRHSHYGRMNDLGLFSFKHVIYAPVI